jgi:tetratricopeptide (TPR) repeat protein
MIYTKLLLSSALIKYLKKNYQSSIDSINKLNLLLETRNLNTHGYILKHMYQGTPYLEQKNYILAIKSFKKADSISMDKNYFHPSIRENYELLVNYYKEQNATEKQLIYIDKLLKTDSITDANFAYLAQNIQHQI